MKYVEDLADPRLEEQLPLGEQDPQGCYLRANTPGPSAMEEEEMLEEQLGCLTPGPGVTLDLLESGSVVMAHYGTFPFITYTEIEYT